VSVPLILEDILLSKGQRRCYSDSHITVLSNNGENIKNIMKRKVENWLFESLYQPSVYQLDLLDENGARSISVHI
jgi:hypothetical protein